MRRSLIAVLLVLGACRQVFGLDPPSLIADHDAPATDGTHAAIDGAGSDGAIAIDAGPTIMVQQTTATGSGSSVLATLPAVTAIGDLLVVISASAGPVQNVQGGGVTTWDEAGASNALTIWYGVVTSSGAGVTVNYNAPFMGFLNGFDVTEWRGANALDAGKVGMGNGSSASESVNALSARDLVVFGVLEENLGSGSGGTPAPGSWTALTPVNTTAYLQYAWFELLPAAGTVSPSVMTSGGTWFAGIAAFKP